MIANDLAKNRSNVNVLPRGTMTTGTQEEEGRVIVSFGYNKPNTVIAHQPFRSCYFIVATASASLFTWFDSFSATEWLRAYIHMHEEGEEIFA